MYNTWKLVEEFDEVIKRRLLLLEAFAVNCSANVGFLRLVIPVLKEAVVSYRLKSSLLHCELG